MTSDCSTVDFTVVVDLKNFDSHAVQMSGWRIDDEAGTFYTFGSFVLQPGASVRVHNCTGTNSATDLYNGACQAVWNNGGECVPT